jgi:hypothetical protein
MSLATMVQPVFASFATTIGTALTYRTYTNGAWSGTTTVYGEVKATMIAEEMDDYSGTKVRRQRATAKLYDQTSLVAPTLKIGDEIIDASSVYWKIHAFDKAEIGNGIYRYHLVRDIPLRGAAERGQTYPEGSDASVTGNTMSTFTGTNIEGAATIFYGAVCYITSSGFGLARNDTLGKSAFGLCTVNGGVAVGGTATVASENAVTLTDWTAVAGIATLTGGALYWLAAVPGQITSVKPVAGWLQPVGTASSNGLTLDLEIVQPIQL